MPSSDLARRLARLELLALPPPDSPQTALFADLLLTFGVSPEQIAAAHRAGGDAALFRATLRCMAGQRLEQQEEQEEKEAPNGR